MTLSTAEAYPSDHESLLLARYLDREMDAAETAAFESYAIDKPHLLASIDADTMLGIAFKKYAASLEQGAVV